MNNLLRTLTESQVKPAADLRLLLTSVKEARRQSYDTKLADPFYDSLEGLLVDLKTITIDNRDAEAFLKPVSRAEVPDYYDVISNPMDFQTMLKKIKQKQYKSKREFKDDLDLIWSNCYTYNASENHPLRQCANRLRVKAEMLLMHITDRKERWDPAIPSDLPSPTGVARVKINGTNGHMNGRSSHTRSPSLPQPSTPTSALAKHSYTVGSRLRHGISFQDSPAIVRTPEGMATFRDLDAQTGSFQPSNTLASTLRDMAITVEYESDSETPADDSMAVDGQAAGDKRKSNGANHRPRKRARYTVPYATPIPDERNDVSQLWWGAVQSDALLANGLPGIPFGPSCSTSHKRKAKRTKPPKRVKEEPPSNPKSLLVMMNANIKTMRRVRHTHAKFAAMNAATAPPEEDENGETPAPGYGTGMVGGAGPGTSRLPPPTQQGMGFGVGLGLDDDVVDDRIDEAPWSLGRGKLKGKGKTRLTGVGVGERNASDCMHWATEKVLEHVGFQGTSKGALDVLSDVAGEFLLNVGRTIRFLSDKFGKTMTPEEIILHTLFESGTSKIQDLERYISDDIERYGTRLGELEKKLVSAYRETTAGEAGDDETGLFEEEEEEETGGLALGGDFLDYTGDDYFGLRELGIAAEFGLSSLSIPKRLLKGKKAANRPAEANKPTEPPPPFPPPPPFVPFTNADVEDQIGLLKPYYQNRFAIRMAATQPIAVGGGMPSLPGPSMGMGMGFGGIPPLPGPTLLPLPPPPPGPGGLPPTNVPGYAGGSTAPAPLPTISMVPPPDMVLLDDSPNPAQMKITPTGGINKPGASTTTTKKKAAAAAAAAKSAGDAGSVVGGMGVGAGGVPMSIPGPGVPGTPTVPGMASGGVVFSAMGPGVQLPTAGPMAAAPKKKKATTGIGSGNGKKKQPAGLPPVVIASA